MVANPYPGINAHVNSMLQTSGTPEQPAMWHSFHNSHIGHITDALNSRIRPRYIAFNDQSLQTRGYDSGGEVEIFQPIPEVTVFQRSSGGQTLPVAELTPTWRAALADVMEPIPQPRAVVIYELLSQAKLGRVIARIELLSPSNKPNGTHYRAYRAKREFALETGIPLIEIDYLHESPTFFRQLPAYPREKLAYPFHVLISDPRPAWGSGEIQAFSWRLNNPVAPFPLPLDKDERTNVDLNTIYQHTLNAGPWLDLIDYAQPPERFETYSADDQAFIREIMEKAGA